MPERAIFEKLKPVVLILSVLTYMLLFIVGSGFITFLSFSLLWVILFFVSLKQVPVKYDQIFAYTTFQTAATLVTLATWGNAYELVVVFVNALYLLGYVALLHYLIVKINFIEVWQKYRIYAIILSVFTVIAIYYLLLFVFQNESIAFYSIFFYTSIIFSLIVIILFALSLLNLVRLDSKKSLLLFFMVVSISFSQMIQAAINFSVKASSLVVYVIWALNILGYLSLYILRSIKDGENYKVLP